MSVVNKNCTDLYVKEESVRGVAEVITEADALDVSSDYTLSTVSFEAIERKQFSAGEGPSKNHQGAKSVAWSAQVELTPALEQGEAPVYAPLLSSLVSSPDSVPETEILAVVSTSKIKVPTGSGHKVGMVVTVENSAGTAKHTSTIKDLVAGEDDDEITFAHASPVTLTTTDVIRPVVSFLAKNGCMSAKKTLTVKQVQNHTRHTTLRGVVIEKGEFAINVNEIPSLTVDAQGLDSVLAVGQAPMEAEYPEVFPLVARNAVVLVNGVDHEIRECGVSYNVVLANKEVLNGGKVDIVATARQIEGSFVGYLNGDLDTLENLHKNNSEITVQIFIPDSAMSGNYSSVIGISALKATITELSYADADGLTTVSCSWRAFVSGDGKSEFGVSYS